MAPLPREKMSFNISERIALFLNEKVPQLINKPEEDDPFYQGRYDNRMEYGILAGFYKTPFTDIFEGMLSSQGYGLCGDLEMEFMNCLEAYGIPQSYKKCRYLSEDLFECITRRKQTLRIEAMRRERRRQYYRGEREIKYAMPPKLGSYGLGF